MSYLCSACKKPTKHNQVRRVHTERRLNGQIARELQVCEECFDLLEEGDVTFSQLLSAFRPLHTRSKDGSRGAPVPASKLGAVAMKIPQRPGTGRILERFPTEE